MENNAKLQLLTGISKSNKTYYYLLVTVDNKEVSRIFIKETEIPYYKNLLKEV